MGSIINLNIIFSDKLVDLIEKLKLNNYKIYSAAIENGVSYKKVDFSSKKALIIGNEANGIEKDVLDSSDYRIFIPILV